MLVWVIVASHLMAMLIQTLSAKLSIATVIVESARRLRIDLAVMATHGKSGMAAFWTGSVAHKVCSEGRLPLLLVPADKEMGTE